jgi:hypothetical protein
MFVWNAVRDWIVLGVVAALILVVVLFIVFCGYILDKLNH